MAYATEEILLILVLAGTAAADLTVPIALALAGLVVVVRAAGYAPSRLARLVWRGTRHAARASPART